MFFNPVNPHAQKDRNNIVKLSLGKSASSLCNYTFISVDRKWAVTY